MDLLSSFVDYTVCIIIIHVCVCTFVGCCLATRGVRGLLWAKGWVWLTESWPVGLLGNSQQNCYITLGCMSCITTMYIHVHFIGGSGHRNCVTHMCMYVICISDALKSIILCICLECVYFIEN